MPWRLGRVILDCAMILDARLNREIRRVQRIERNDVPAVERVVPSIDWPRKPQRPELVTHRTDSQRRADRYVKRNAEPSAVGAIGHDRSQ